MVDKINFVVYICQCKLFVEKRKGYKMATGTTPTPTPTPGRDKKWWLIHASAGVGVLALIIFGLSQCGGKNGAEEECRDAAKVIAKTDSLLNEATKKVKSISDYAEELKRDNRAKADTIVELRDSIVVLNDSIVGLNDSLGKVNERLVDCKKSKKNKPVQKQPVKKQPVKKQPAKKDTVVVVHEYKPAPQDNKNTRGNGDVIISNGGAVNTDINLSNGGTNNGTIIIGDNAVVHNHRKVVAADTLARATHTRQIVIECEVSQKRRVYR